MHVQIEIFKTCRWQHLVNTVFAVITGGKCWGKHYSVREIPSKSGSSPCLAAAIEIVEKKLRVYEQLSNVFQHFLDFHGPTKQHPFPSIFPNKNFKTSVGIYTSQIYTNKLSARIGMGFYCLRPFVCQKGRHTSWPNYNSAHDDWNLGQDRCTNLHVKVF